MSILDLFAMLGVVVCSSAGCTWLVLKMAEKTIIKEAEEILQQEEEKIED